MISLIYNGVEIADDLNVIITKAIYRDNACGRADEADLCFSDAQKLWRTWNPQKNDTFRVSNDGVSSGIMYVSEIAITGGSCTLKGLSTTQTALEVGVEAWEEITLRELVESVAYAIDLAPSLIGAPDVTYGRIERHGSRIGFLNDVMTAESMAIKVYDGDVIGYMEADLEAADPVMTIAPEDMLGSPEFETSDAELIRSLTYVWQPVGPAISGTATAQVVGRDIILQQRGESIGQLERWAKGALRARNKRERTGMITIRAGTGVTAGNTIAVSGYGSFDGKWFVDCAEHDFVGHEQRLFVRGIPNV